MRPVQVGVTTGQERVIATGVQQGERVVVDGLQKVRTAHSWCPRRRTPKAAQRAMSEGSKN